MARDFFRQATAGVSPQGSLISQIQTTLNAVPNAPQIRVDGDFGGNTSTAVRNFQASNHLQPTGAVTDQVWQMLTNSGAPSMFERCLQVTASYEGTGYTHVVGNFDGAGITWGIIGFTLLAGGELGVVIKKINIDFPALVAQAFGANAAELLRICDPATSAADKTAFANSVTRNGGGVIEPWNTSFQTLGGFPQVSGATNSASTRHLLGHRRGGRPRAFHGRGTRPHIDVRCGRAEWRPARQPPVTADQGRFRDGDACYRASAPAYRYPVRDGRQQPGFGGRRKQPKILHQYRQRNGAPVALSAI